MHVYVSVQQHVDVHVCRCVCIMYLHVCGNKRISSFGLCAGRRVGEYPNSEVYVRGGSSLEFLLLYTNFGSALTLAVAVDGFLREIRISKKMELLKHVRGFACVVSEGFMLESGFCFPSFVSRSNVAVFLAMLDMNAWLGGMVKPTQKI